MNCSLCQSPDTLSFYSEAPRHYYECQKCKLIVIDPKNFLSPEEEKKRYSHHENNPYDQDYRQFLNQLTQPLMKKLNKGDSGLDYGSGPGPTLSVMMNEKGFPTKNYDPFFSPDASFLNQRYHFITASETIEHFRNPKLEFGKLYAMLKPGGWIALMTQILLPTQDFAKWWYKNDPTHICFYQQPTFEWIANAYSLRIEYPNTNVVLFQKSADTSELKA